MTVVPEPVDAGCAWPIDSACFDESWAGLDSDIQDRSQMLASLTLRRLTGNRVGGCAIKVRPCKASCARGFFSYYDATRMYGSYAGYWPFINAQGLWVNGCGHYGADCGCATLCEVILPGPVGRLDEVLIDGDVVDSSSYRLDGNRLVWTDDTLDCEWPACQDLSLDDEELGTFSVTYLNAYPVDTLGAYAAGVLAMEYAKACTGAKCRLPTGVQSITRQGVSYQIEAGSFPGGFTGIREVDAYIALWNPGGLRQRPRVWSPDLRSPRVVSP